MNPKDDPINLKDLSINSPSKHDQRSSSPPTQPERKFKKAMTLFVKPHMKDGKQEFEEVFGAIQIPVEYSPDTNDRFHRPPTSREQGKDDHFHVIPGGNSADIISAVQVNGVSKSVAAKRYKIEQLNGTIDGFTRLRREVQISRFNRHENIVRFYEVFVETPLNPTHIWLVTERMDHTLEKYFEHLRRKDHTEEPVTRDLRHMGALLTQLLRALDYLHQRGIMHRDVTPRNIGMNQKEFEIKLLDFGLARETNPKLRYFTNVDTLYIYKPLEIIMRAKYNTGVDIWAAALVAIEMLGMKSFMPTGSDEEITKKIRKRGAENVVKDRIFAVLGVPEDQYKAIFGRPVIEKAQLGQFDEILNTKLEPRLGGDDGPLKKDDFIELIKGMLNPDMRNRLRADECLLHPFLRILNEKYEQRQQPREDNGMQLRNEKDKKFLINEPTTFIQQKMKTDLNNLSHLSSSTILPAAVDTQRMEASRYDQKERRSRIENDQESTNAKTQTRKEVVPAGLEESLAPTTQTLTATKNEDHGHNRGEPQQANESSSRIKEISTATLPLLRLGWITLQQAALTTLLHHALHNIFIALQSSLTSETGESLVYNTDGTRISSFGNIPPRYSPDLVDTFRPAGLPYHAFHQIGTRCNQKPLAATFEGNRVVVKRYDLTKQTATHGDTRFLYAGNEASVIMLNHRNIVKVKDIFAEKNSDGSSRILWIATERAEMSLDYYFKSIQDRKLTHEEVQQLCVQLFRVLLYLQEKHMLHLDFTPQNIGWYKKEKHSVLFDFEGAQNLTSEEIREQWVDEQSPRTWKLYWPIELVLEQGFSTNIDSWGAGLVILEMLGILEPFGTHDDWYGFRERILDQLGVQEDQTQLFDRALDSEKPRPGTLRENLQTRISNRMEENQELNGQLRDLLLGIFQLDPRDRLAPQQLLQLPYLHEMNKSMAHLYPPEGIVEKEREKLEWLMKLFEKLIEK